MPSSSSSLRPKRLRNQVASDPSRQRFALAGRRREAQGGHGPGPVDINEADCASHMAVGERVEGRKGTVATIWAHAEARQHHDGYGSSALSRNHRTEDNRCNLPSRQIPLVPTKMVRNRSASYDSDTFTWGSRPLHPGRPCSGDMQTRRVSHRGNRHGIVILGL